MRRLLPLLLLAVLPAWAEQSATQPLPAVPPPPPGMEAFDSALEPEVTIVKGERETREEFRMGGKLYMVKVTPAVGRPYFLVDRHGDGIFIETDIEPRPTRPPMWIIHSW
ncbi:MAG: DUF2782 domain-containing protein [Azonexus sp.]|jgi:hypothetical protein|uniref:DUF2782 domain-containing protein n=1 Tax=Azonexus sp. TaxID=1872668 RepID=UPI0028249706|nr:DUF2782 domain-containing protein [Azonexus sp.]MDR0777472.1 DUF2782 domain-containing protein [Azonexus sp.]